MPKIFLFVLSVFGLVLFVSVVITVSNFTGSSSDWADFFVLQTFGAVFGFISLVALISGK